MSIDKDGSGEDGGKILYCSFCGKSQNDVRKLIAGPSVFICDECVWRTLGGPLWLHHAHAGSHDYAAR